MALFDNTSAAGHWPRTLAGLVLIALGVAGALRWKVVSLDASSVTLMLVGVCLCILPLTQIMRRLASLKAGTTGVELVLDKLSTDAREDLSGLSGHDIWALDDLVAETQKYPVTVDGLATPNRVMVRTFLDLNLLVIVPQGDQRIVVPTELAHEILRAAKTIKI